MERPVICMEINITIKHSGFVWKNRTGMFLFFRKKKNIIEKRKRSMNSYEINATRKRI